MPIHLKVETELDQSSAQRAARDAKSLFSNAGSDASRVFTSEFSTGLVALRGLFDEFGQGLSSGLEGHLRGIGSSFEGISSKVSGIGLAGFAAVAGVAAVGVAAVEAGKQLYDLGEQWDEITDKITIRTGIIGDQLKELTDNVANVADKTAASPGQIGDVLGQLVASLNLQGAPLETLTKQISDYDQMNQNAALNIREFGKVMREFQVPAADVGATLDTLNNVAQRTQVPLNQLVHELYDAGPTADVFGLSISQLTNVLGIMEDSGINSEKAVTGLRLSLANLAADKKPLQDAMGGAFSPDEPALNRLKDAIQKIQDLEHSGNEIAAIDLGKTVFGKSWVDLGDDILHSKINVDTLNTSVTNIGPTIEEQRQATKHWGEDFTILKNQISDALRPLAEDVFSAVDTGMQKFEEGMLVMIGRIKADWVSALGSMWDDSPLGQILGTGPHPSGIPAVPPGQAIPGQYSGQTPTIGGIPIPGLQQPNAVFGPTPPFGPGSLGGGPGAQAERRGSYPPGGGPPADDGGFGLLPETETGKKGPRLPEAPVLPFSTNLPTGFADLPQTASMFSAETAYLDAQHTLEEKQARLTQLQQTNAATADDIQKARNDVAEAERRQQETELRLYDTRQQLFDKSNKQLNNYLNDMNGISAGLDKDLGISKGLAGMADNLVRFLATMAAAPLLGQLSASATAQEQNAPGSSGGLIPQILGRMGLLNTGSNTGTSSSAGGSSAVLAPGGGITMMPSAGSSSGSGGSSALLPWGSGGSSTDSGGSSTDSGGSAAPNPAFANYGGGIPPPAVGNFGAAGWRNTVAGVVAKYGPQMNIPQSQYQAWTDAIVSQIGTESSGNPNADNPNDPTGRGGTQHVSGLLQYLPSSYASSGGKLTGLPYMDPIGQIAGALFAPRNSDGSPNTNAPGGIGAGHGWGPTAYSPSAAVAPAPMYSPSQAKSVTDAANAAVLHNAGIPGFETGGAIPMADPHYEWGPPTPGVQQGTESWADNPGGIIPPKMGPSTGGWSPGSLPDIAHKIQAMPKMQGGGGVPIMAHAGEHMLTTSDVAAMGGQNEVYKFRSMLHMQGGGPIPPIPLAPPPPPPPPPPVSNNAGPAPSWFGGNLPGIWGMIGEAAGNQPGGIGQAAGTGIGPQSVQPGQQPSSRSPGGGSASGGAPVALAEAAASIFPGGGAAASVLMQLITRGIKYAGQAASIGVMGLMETFLPGGTELSDPSKSLVGRVASGIAGGQPASPNQAAKAKPPQAPPPPAGSPASGRGAGPLPGPPGSERPQIVIQNQTIQTPDTGAYEREMSRIAASHAAGDNTR